MAGLSYHDEHLCWQQRLGKEQTAIDTFYKDMSLKKRREGELLKNYNPQKITNQKASYYDHNGDPWLEATSYATSSAASNKAPSVAGSRRSARSSSQKSNASRFSRATKNSLVAKQPSIASKRSQSIAEDLSVSAKQSVASAISQFTTQSQREYIEQLERTLVEERKRRIEAEARLE